jgi:hypothetical protein
MAPDESNLRCRVCGFRLAEPPWGDDGTTPQYDICPCCGSESGYHDCTPKAARSNREKWINGGAKWFHPEMKPRGWILLHQLAWVPSGYRGKGISQVWPTRYRDERGEVVTAIQNDGDVLTMKIRGIEFHGIDFEGFTPPHEVDRSICALKRGCLSYCTLQVDIPVPVVLGADTEDGILSAHLKLGDGPATGQRDPEVLVLELRFDAHRFSSRGKSGLFEAETCDIQKQLPSEAFLKACVNCALSTYSPYGTCLFGRLSCFRGNKQAFLSVKDKDDLLAIFDTQTEFVQETYLCPEFQRRSYPIYGID